MKKEISKDSVLSANIKGDTFDPIKDFLCSENSWAADELICKKCGCSLSELDNHILVKDSIRDKIILKLPPKKPEEKRVHVNLKSSSGKTIIRSEGDLMQALSNDEIENRKRVAAFIKREEKIGIDQKKATSEFIKEASYTWINRLLGLKCMECRGLIEEVITTRPEYGGRSKRHRDFRDKNPDKAAQPDDALIACLFSAFEEVTDEIKVLFDPKNE